MNRLSLVVFGAFALAHSAAHADDNRLSRQYQTDALKQFTDGVHKSFPAPQPSQWSDVKSWKPIGTRFAAAYDANQRLIAVYDLSYPSMISPINLAEIANPQVTGDRLVQAWNQVKTSQDRLTGSELSALQALGSAPANALRSAGLSADWWKGLPWVSPMKAAPDSFRITDFDLGKIQIGGELVSGLRHAFQIVLADNESIDRLSDQDILNSFRFVRTRQGGYQIQWSDPRFTMGASLPRKLLDFSSVQNGLYDDIGFDAAIGALGEAATFIPVPVVEALVATAISRFGRYYDMTQDAHLEMLRELIIETSEGSNPDGVLSQLSVNDQKTLIDTFVWARVTPIDVWEWLFKDPVGGWNQDQKQAISCANQSKYWLAERHDTVSDLNARFSIAETPQGSKSLILDSICRPQNPGPEVSINYSAPGEIATARITTELVGVAFEFATQFLPIAGFPAREAYTLAIQDSIDTVQYWEARLMQHLEVRPDSSSWTNEMTILENQRINPFEMSGADTARIISERRTLIGL